MQTADIEILNKLLESILAEKEVYINLSREIWERPELGFEEKFACERQIQLLRGSGFTVESPFGGIETAYKALRGNGNPAFCFVAEYDALPGLGHGCGHNLICSAAIAAASALTKRLDESGTEGTVVVMGTPGEESKGGKVIMLRNNALDGINALMMVHPSWRTLGDPGSTAIRRFEISFKGKAAHAAAAPELGINALDAVIAVFNGVGAWRQQLPESARIHGIISDGGKVPNIIPDYAECRFFLRSPDDLFLDEMEKRFREIIKGATLVSGTDAEIKSINLPYKSRKINTAMNNAYTSASSELGLEPVVPEHPGRGSSDFGDFSHAKPGIHAYFGIAKKEIGGHSLEFAEAAGSDYGMEQMLKAAAAMAFTGYKFITDKDFREKVISESH